MSPLFYGKKNNCDFFIFEYASIASRTKKENGHVLESEQAGSVFS